MDTDILHGERHDARRIFIDHVHPVHAHVSAQFRVLRNGAVQGDVRTAISRGPFEDREMEKVNLIACTDDLLAGAGLDNLRRQPSALVFHYVGIMVADLLRWCVVRQPERQCDPGEGTEEVCDERHPGAIHIVTPKCRTLTFVQFPDEGRNSLARHWFCNMSDVTLLLKKLDEFPNRFHSTPPEIILIVARSRILSRSLCLR